jgi:predicted enzyme related to lactoylglutathione lyase
MGASSRFFWHDLMAADVEGAKKFYGELFGWKFKGDKKDDYVHINAGDVGIGGIMKNPSPVPPHWIGYINVEDVDKTVADIQKYGGKVLMPKTNVPEVGEFAYTADALGAAFSPIRYVGKDANKPEPDRAGMWNFCWDELHTPDPAASAKFYSTIFGWGVDTMDMGGGMQYTLLKRKGVKDSQGTERSAGGVMKMMPGTPHPFWMAYVAVEKADASTEKAKRLGATVLVQPTDIPNIGRFACLMDPQKAAISILQPSR